MNCKVKKHMIVLVLSYQKETPMSTACNYKNVLTQLCKYKSLKTTFVFLKSSLLILAFYMGYYQLSLIPFYLLILASILPSLLCEALNRKDPSLPMLVYVGKQIGYSNSKYRTSLFTFYLTLILLLLWYLRFLNTNRMSKYLQIIPPILIISSLLINTIGQYYYFTKFDKHLNNNEHEQIH